MLSAKPHEYWNAYLRTSLLPTYLRSSTLFSFMPLFSSPHTLTNIHIASRRKDLTYDPGDSNDDTPRQCEETRDSKKAAAGQVARHTILHSNARISTPWW